MAHSEAWAKRLLAGMRRPAELLERRSYRDPTFLRLYLDHLDEILFHDPKKGLKWAEVAPRLALLVPEGEGSEGRQVHRETLVRALSILGGALRATSQHGAAEEQYQAALQIVESETLSPAARADLSQRWSYLRACQGRHEESLEMLDEALEVYGLEPGIDRSRALVRRGYVLEELERFSEAIGCLGEVLRVTNPKESAAAARTYHSAVHNLAYAVSHSDSGDAWTALKFVRRARTLLKGQRRCIARHKLNWLEGLIWRLVHMDARAEQAFNVARRGFIRLRAPWEVALVSIDLATLHRDFAEWEKLETLATDTLARFRTLSGNTATVAALSLCVDSARARRALDRGADCEVVAKARREVVTAIDAARELVVARMTGQ